MLILKSKCISQETLWQGKGRIIISADGNEHDHDDWAGTPLSLAIIASRGLQDKMPLYIYSDHIWGSNHEHPGFDGITPYEQMKESAVVGGKQFGFKKTKFICGVDDPEIAYNELTQQINLSTEDNPLYIVISGPTQVVGESISRADINKRKFVTIISTIDCWNNKHANQPYTKWENHTGWTFEQIKNDFATVEGGSLKISLIPNQTTGLQRNWKEYEWLLTAPEKNNPYYKKGSWEWLFYRLCASAKPMGVDRDYYYAIDPTDAGKTIFLLTGNENADPNFCYELLRKPIINVKKLSKNKN